MQDSTLLLSKYRVRLSYYFITFITPPYKRFPHQNMVGTEVGSMRSSGLEASRNATIIKQLEENGASIAPIDNNPNVLRQLLNNLRTLCSDEDDDSDTITVEDTAEAVNTINQHNKSWKEMQTMKYTVYEMMFALEEVVQEILVYQTPNAASGAYASLVAPPMTKTPVKVRVEGAKYMQEV